MPMMRTSVENLVIGGGPAGSMLALRLASAGREVMLLEREREPGHKVCGEFLSTEAVEYLRSIGIEPLHLGAVNIDRVRLHSGGRQAESRLPFTALSLSRRILDKNLLERAASARCTVRRGASVEKIRSAGLLWTAHLRTGSTIDAGSVFLATGKHDLTDWPRPSQVQSDLVGFKMYWRLHPTQTEALRGLMELFLFRDGYGGLSLVENEIANLCFVVRRRRLRQHGGWNQLLPAIRRELPQIDELLHSGTPCWDKPLAISPIPYGHLGGPANGIWRVGDQAAVIPSFTGDGISIALHTAELAAELFLNGSSPDSYLRSLESQLRPGMDFASRLSRAMVTPAARVFAPAALALVPGAMSWIAKRTRIPARALLSSVAAPNPGITQSSASLT
jgi:menaquinone-9 beta-reductase